MLTFGYKASAEQFGPRELLEFSVIAEEVGVRLRGRERPLPALAPYGGHAPYSLCLAGGAGRAHALVSASAPAL